MINKLKPKSEFKRNVLTLMTGTVLAQAIPLAISPILTRMYSPEEFGMFALYFAIISIISVVITGKYELAIMVTRKDIDAANIVILSIIIATFISLILLIVVIVFNDFLTSLLGNEAISNWLYFIPFSVFIAGLYQSFYYWSSRKKQYIRLSTNKIIQSTSVASGHITIGSVGATPYGLIVGTIFGRFIATIALVKLVWSNDRKLFKMVSKRRIIINMNKYIEYPKYSSWASLLDSFSLEAPIFFITKFYDMSIVGFYSHTMRVLGAPAGIISGSIGEVYFQKISMMAHKNPENIRQEINNTVKKLAILAIIVFLPIILYGDQIFSFIFGEKWIVAGDYAKILSIALIARFIVSPLSSIFAVTNNIKLGSAWQTIYFITTISVLTVAAKYTIITFMWAFVINEVFMYLIYYFFMLHAAKKYSERYI